MGNDLPDYKTEVTAQRAARLGIINPFDYRGSVIWIDDFEDNINKWAQSMTGTGASIALSTEAARNGAKSVKLVTGNASGNYASIYHYNFLPVVGRKGGEFSFALGPSVNRLDFLFYFYDGTKRFSPRIRYESGLHCLRYFDKDNVDQILELNLELYESPYLFHTMKLVVDSDNGYYTRLLLDSIEYDLSSYPMYASAVAIVPRLYYGILIDTAGATSPYIYVDDFIATENEP